MNTGIRVADPPTERPLLIFDGDCGFCRLWINRWRQMTRDGVAYATSQEIANRYPGIPADLYARSVVFIGTDGGVSSGAEAVLRALARAPRGGWALWLYQRFRVVAALTEALYAFIASRRGAFSRLTRLLWGPTVLPPSFAVARCLFLRAMGLIYLIAFVSLWVQIDGLIGSHGILPVATWLQRAAGVLGPERFVEIPTLCWINSSDAFLHLQCGAGTLLALLAMVGFAPMPVFALLWLLYLSLTVAGQIFLGFQWDNLLLESGFLSILLSPLAWRCRTGCEPTPARLPMALTHWLVFRLMFSSGVVKLSSGDPTWRGLTALTVHYQTQCLPPWTAWYAHQLPLLFQKISCAAMFAVELAAPLLIVAPRRLRHLGAFAMIGLQVIILSTGNYGFFNLLSIALCATLLDDTFWPAGWSATHQPAAGHRARRWPAIIMVPLASVIFVAGVVRLGEAFRTGMRWPAPIRTTAELISPFRSVNWYGLFSNMTTSRPEIVIEGSSDGVTWRAYEFKWKPGDTKRAPSFVAPHMPRLDWQMWFAALGDYRSNQWFVALLGRLLEGSPEVLGLLETNPFASAPPRYLRGVLYDYRFTDRRERLESSDWWHRTRQRDYTPVYSRRQE
ncbi:MAG TPA: lipase maturation factor family protein [Patescibacteria group bacterium]|nr:lipase maturation factor family protein [Patescibacteria group bacterium]